MPVPRVSISDIRHAVEAETGLAAAHMGSYPVHENLGSGIFWRGDVEVFKVVGHAQADKAYAWGWLDEEDIRYHVVLNVAPINTATDAVKIVFLQGGG